MPLTIEDIREVCKRTTYKPGYRFEVYDITGYYNIIGLNVNGQVQITLHTGDLPDADGKRPTVNVQLPKYFYYNDIPDIRCLVSLLKEMVTTVELHERDEWFKFEGVQVTDPHPELRKTKESEKLPEALFSNFKFSSNYEDISDDLRRTVLDRGE